MTPFNSGATDDQCHAVPTYVFENSPSDYVSNTWPHEDHGVALLKESRVANLCCSHFSFSYNQTQNAQSCGSAQYIPAQSGLWLVSGLLEGWGPWPLPGGMAWSLVVALLQRTNNRSQRCPAGRRKVWGWHRVLAPCPLTSSSQAEGYSKNSLQAF